MHNALSAFHWQGKPSIFYEPIVAQQRRDSARANSLIRAERNAEIFKLYTSGVSRRELSERFDLSRYYISEITRNAKTTQP